MFGPVEQISQNLDHDLRTPPRSPYVVPLAPGTPARRDRCDCRSGSQRFCQGRLPASRQTGSCRHRRSRPKGSYRTDCLLCRVQLSIPCETREVATARRFVARCLGPQAHVPVLLTSELVTNSVTHGPRAPGATIT